MSIDSDVVRAQKSSSEPTIVSASVLFIHTDNDKTLFGCFDELVAPGSVPVRDLIATFFLAIMVPSDFLIGKDLGHLYEATEMNGLAPCNNEFSFAHATIANVGGAVRNILQESAIKSKQQETPMSQKLLFAPDCLWIKMIQRLRDWANAM